MAVYQYKSPNQAMNEGATDGKYRKARPHTDVAPGLGEELVKANRAGLHPFFNYGFIDTESSNQVSPGAAETKSGPAPAYAAPVSYLTNYSTSAQDQ